MFRAVFLDVAQAFDKVWHKGLMLKLVKCLPKQYLEVLKAYITSSSSNRQFKSRGTTRKCTGIQYMYKMHTADVPSSTSIIMATFVDDTPMLSMHSNPNTSSHELQTHISKIELTFTLNRRSCPKVNQNSIKIQKAT